MTRLDREMAYREEYCDVSTHTYKHHAGEQKDEQWIRILERVLDEWLAEIHCVVGIVFNVPQNEFQVVLKINGECECKHKRTVDQ